MNPQDQQDYQCPSCGAPLTFYSKMSIYTTCTFCKSTVVRHDMDLEAIGKEAFLLEDMSPFQIGTEGSYKGKTFFLAGRIKLIWKSGNWSEWYALFEDGTEGWLSEAQGFYMMSFITDPGREIPAAERAKVGMKMTHEGTQYIIDDRRKVTYQDSEGELPFVFKKGYEGYSVDFRSTTGKFANILYGPDGSEFYVGEYLPFNKFNFKNLKTVRGWEQERP